MIKFFSVVIIIFLYIPGVLSQGTFQAAYGGTVTEHLWGAVAGGEHYFLSGQTTSYGTGAADAYLFKTTTAGDTIWSAAYGGSSAEYATKIVYAHEEQLFTIGHTYSFGAGDGDAFLTSLDGSGNIVWTKTFGGEENEDFTCITRNNHSTGYLMVGATRSFGEGNWDIWAVNLTGLGDTLWTRTYGGIGLDEAHDVIRTPDDGFLIAGATENGDGIFLDALLIKIDLNGDLLWSKGYGGEKTDIFYDIIPVHEGGFLAVGSTDSYDSLGANILVTRIDDAGNELWSKTYGGDWGDAAREVTQNEDGSFLLSGTTTSYAAGSTDMFLMNISSSGDANWFKSYGSEGDEYGRCHFKTHSGVVVAGISSEFGAGTFDFYVAKVDHEGNSDCATLVEHPSVRFVDVDVNNLELVANYPSLTIMDVGFTRKYGTEITPICSDFSTLNEYESNDQIQLYIDQVNRDLHVNFSSGLIGESVNIFITNVKGQQVLAKELIIQSEIIVDLAKISAGIHIISIVSDTRRWNEKLVLE